MKPENQTHRHRNPRMSPWASRMLFLALLWLMAGCAAQVRKVPVSFGFEEGHNSGFFATATALPAVPADSVRVQVATMAQLRNKRMIPELGNAVQYDRGKAVFVEPSDVVAVLDGAGVQFLEDPPENTVTLGEVFRGVPSPTPSVSGWNKKSNHPSGLNSISKPGGSFDEEFQDAIRDLRARVGKYGGDAIVNLRVVFNAEDSTDYVRMSGRTSIWVIRADVVRVLPQP